VRGSVIEAVRQGESGLADTVNLAERRASFEEHWKPRIVGMLNDYEVILIKVQGDFVWHKHDETDFFLVIKGHLTIQLRDRNVKLDEGEMFVVPRGGEHFPHPEHAAPGRNDDSPQAQRADPGVNGCR
jgi:mannose-6-phosphate isomerase-like protein (cupin superfamily)